MSVDPNHNLHQRSASKEWSEYVRTTPSEIRVCLHDILDKNRDDLQRRYLSYLASDSGMSAILVGDEARLDFSETFMRWVEELVQLDADSPDDFFEKQAGIGRLMARVGMPPHALSRAMRKLKLWFLVHLAERGLPPEQLVEAMRFVITIVDICVEIREGSYQSGATAHARIEEAYRMHSLGQNLAMERERQRAFLMEWGHLVLSSLHQDGATLRLPRLWKSEFGLWVNHKARMLFETEAEIDLIAEAIDRIDGNLVPSLEQSLDASRSTVRSLIRRLEEELGTIKFALNALFDARLEIENGRDPLTQLLNRRFLPAVLMREIALQKRRIDQGFCLLLVDVDHFKQVNDLHGHQAGDLALQQVAEAIAGSARPSDFVFRYGGEEFVIVLIDCNLETGEKVAQRIRQTIDHMAFRLPNSDPLSLTVSMGLASFGGDIDYEALLSRADKALYAAKEAGRNRVAIAPSPHQEREKIRVFARPRAS